MLESYPGGLVEVPIRADGSAGARRVLCDLDPAVPDGVAPMEDGGLLIACYRPDAVLRWHPDEGLSTFAEDVRGTVLAAPTNIAFVGENLDLAIVPNIGRWHLTAIPLPASGVPPELPRHPVSERIDGPVRWATVRAALPEPIHFGDWVMKHREFALVRVRAESGQEGFAFTLTREGPIAATIHRAIAHHYVGSTVAEQDDAARIFHRCQGSNLAGARERHRPPGAVDRRPGRPTTSLARSARAARSRAGSAASRAGCRRRRSSATRRARGPGRRQGAGPRAARRRLAALQDPDRASARVRPRLGCSPRARLPAPDAWLGMDAAWVFTLGGRRASSSWTCVRGASASAWFEDVFPSGGRRHRRPPPRAGRTCRSRWATSRAGSYYPEALPPRGRSTSSASTSRAWGESRAHARWSTACEAAVNSRGRRTCSRTFTRRCSPASATRRPVEWGVPRHGRRPVRRLARAVRRSSRDGLDEPLPVQHGFGPLVQRRPGSWTQDHDDPDGLVAESAVAARGASALTVIAPST